MPLHHDVVKIPLTGGGKSILHQVAKPVRIKVTYKQHSEALWEIQIQRMERYVPVGVYLFSKWFLCAFAYLIKSDIYILQI